MALSLLASEVLSQVVNCLLAHDVYHLFFCGSRALNAKLSSSTLALYFQLNRFSKFPFSAYSLPQLRKMVIDMKTEHARYPLRLNMESMLPSQPLKSLTWLKISCAQSLTILSKREPLDQLLPNLQVLKLLNISQILVLADLKRLPSTLRSLTLKCAAGVKTVFMHRHWIRILPPSLESLVLSSVTWIPSRNDSEDDGDDSLSPIDWPPTLHTLKVKSVHAPYVLQLLPSGLRKFVGALTSSERSRIPLSSLPPSLTYFILTQGYSNTIVLDVPMNTNLKLWQVSRTMTPEEANKPYDDDSSLFTTKMPLELIPKSVTSFSGVESLITSENVSHLPPSLTKLTISESIPRSVFLHLPLQLTSFIIGSSAYHAHIPYHMLPRTLTLLGAPFATAEELNGLPAIRTLNMSLSPPVPNFVPWGSKAFEKLPRSLTSLSIPLYLLESKDTLLGMPDVRKIVIHGRRMSSSPVAQDPRLMEKLPSSITELRFNMFETHSVVGAWLQDLGRMQSLETLWLTVTGTSYSNTNYSAGVLSYFPDSLKSLRIISDPEWLDQPDVFMKLPPNLHTLRLGTPVIKGRLNPIAYSDAHFTSLPHSLTTLSLSSVEKMTSAFFDKAPPAIYNLHLGFRDRPEDFTDAMRRYYAHERWEGYSPPRD
jgi:hypothetical protein